MQFVYIAGAAALTGVGVGSLAAAAVLWKRAGSDLAVIVRALEAIAE